MTATVWQKAHVHFGDNAWDELNSIGQLFPEISDDSINAALIGMAKCGFSVLMPKLQDGQTEVNQGFIGDVKLRAFKIGLPHWFTYGGWAQNRYDAHADAEKTNGLIAREGCALWSSSCEFEYKGENSYRMLEFINRASEIFPLNQMMTNGHWGISYMPNEADGPFMDWKSVKLGLGRYQPECYPNEYPDSPGQWPSVAIKLAVEDYPKAPSSYVHPLLGFYGAADTAITADRYIANLLSAKHPKGFTYGYGLWLGHGLIKEDWMAFKRHNYYEGYTDKWILAYTPKLPAPLQA